MSSPSRTQQRVLPTPARLHTCRFPGCPKRYIHSTDATRHYDEKHNLQLAASCPISGCMKIISDARKSDKQKEHMRRKHPDEDVNQAWVKLPEFQQPINAGSFMNESQGICQQQDEDQDLSIGGEDAMSASPYTQGSPFIEYWDHYQTIPHIERPIGVGSSNYLDIDLSLAFMSAPHLLVSSLQGPLPQESLLRIESLADTSPKDRMTSKPSTTSTTDTGSQYVYNNDNEYNEETPPLGMPIDSSSATAIETKYDNLYKAIIAKEEELRAKEEDYTTVVRDLNDLKDQLRALSINPRDTVYAIDTNQTDSRVMLNELPTRKRHRAWPTEELMRSMRCRDDPMLNGVNKE